MAVAFGRLIFPVVARIARLDTETTQVDTDFREPIRIPGNTQTGTRARTELAVVNVPVQIDPVNWDRIRLYQAGNSPDKNITLTFHFNDLNLLSLVNANTGDPLIRVNDRLVGIYHTDGTLLETIRTPPGLYITSLVSHYGIGGSRNLLMAGLDDRQITG